MTPRSQMAVLVAACCAIPATALAQPTALTEYALFGTDRVTIGRQCDVTDGAVGSELVTVRTGSSVSAAVSVVAEEIVVSSGVQFDAQTFSTQTLTIPPVIPAMPGSTNISVAPGQTTVVPAGAYGRIEAAAGSTLVFEGGTYDVDTIIVGGSARRPSLVNCTAVDGCIVRVLSQLSLGANGIGISGGPLNFQFSGTRAVTVGRGGAQVRAFISAPSASVRLRSSARARAAYSGRYAGRKIRVGTAAMIGIGAAPGANCGNSAAEPPIEDCDAPDDNACPGQCRSDCQCIPPAGTTATLYAVGPSVFNNASPFGLQLFGNDFLPGAVLELSDKATNAIIILLPTTWLSYTEMTALVPPGLGVPTGIERELVAKVINPGAAKSAPPTIGHCQTGTATAPAACNSNLDCVPGTGNCVTGDQRLTMFNDAVFLNPNSAAFVPPPTGVCDDGTPCVAAATCIGIGGGACSPKVYVTPQQRDELWVYNTGTQQFIDKNAGPAGIQGIPVGDHPFHVEILDATRAWVVNRFDDSFSIIDTTTDTELVRVTGTMLGAPGRLKMETEIEFNRTATRAYLSNENTDQVDVLDIAGPKRDAPELIGAINVGVNPRGMVTNATNTRLYVANIQSADISVVDIVPGSPTENQVIKTIAPRATDDIVGGRAADWEEFVIGGRAPRGIAYSDALNALFITSIGPQTGPRQGVVLTGGAIINPTITVIDAASETILAHVALVNTDPDKAACSDPELLTIDDVRARLYVTCQGSGVVDVLDLNDLVAATPAEVAQVPLPMPVDVPTFTLSLPPATGGFGAKVCSPAASNRGAACTTDADCTGCPALVEGLPVVCCHSNNTIGLHNGPRGIALSSDRNSLYVVNQFTTSVATLDVSPSDPTLIAVTNTRSFPGAFGTNLQQRERRLGQIDFFTDLKKTGVSCATCHIDDHQDGVFFEADVRGPRLRRVLSLRSTRDFSPLLQDQLVPDLVAFTDLVVHAERGGALPCIPCIEINGAPFCFGSGGSECTQTSDDENRQNALYSKAVTFFPNPNLNPDGSFSTTVPLPGGLTGNAQRGAEVFDELACKNCHPEPLFTIDQLRRFEVASLGAPVRMRDVGTPVFLPLRVRCQDGNRPTGADGSTGFTVPTLRGIWDTFPLLLSGAAGLTVSGTEPAFSPGCMNGSSGCCAELESPLNPSGLAVPPQQLEVTTKDAIRAVLTPPLAVPGSGHGGALSLSASDLNALIAYIRSL